MLFAADFGTGEVLRRVPICRNLEGPVFIPEAASKLSFLTFKMTVYYSMESMLLSSV
jgi:hypothetical protein